MGMSSNEASKSDISYHTESDQSNASSDYFSLESESDIQSLVLEGEWKRISQGCQTCGLQRFLKFFINFGSIATLYNMQLTATNV